MNIRNLLTLLAFVVSVDAYGETAFQKAVRSNNLQEIDRLVSTAEDVDVPGTNDKTALMIAAKSGDSDLVNKLLAHGANPDAMNVNGGTPIMFAAISGDVKTIEMLLALNVDVNARGSNGWTALMVAAAKGHAEACRLIINAGADVNAEDIYLWTPLLRSAYEDRADVIKLLLAQEEINIAHQDDHGATALHHAASVGASMIVELLLLSGADPTLEDFSGRTAAVYARENGHSELSNVLRENS